MEFAVVAGPVHNQIRGLSVSAAGGRIQRAVGGRKRALNACLGLLLLACAGLAAVSLLPGRAQSRPQREPRGAITLAQAPAGLRAAVERDAKLSVTSAKRWALHASYGVGSVGLSGAGWSARVGLASAGRGAALSPVSGVVNRGVLAALYGRSVAKESFTTGARGVIQSFTVSKRPSGTGALVLEFGISGLRATGSGRRLNLRNTRNQVVASYRYLRITDARGHAVKASMRVNANGHEIVLDVADRHASYPLQIEPMFAVRNGSNASAPKAAATATLNGSKAPARSTLGASYGSKSVQLSGAKLSGTVGLGQIGRAGALSPISGALSRKAGSALYSGPGITETFTDGLVGVEQSFHIDQRPAGSGPLLLRVGLSGLMASGSGNTLALHTAAGATVGVYGGLRVIDAEGRTVRAGMRPGPGGKGIVISVADRGAHYPLIVDPTFEQTAEITNATSGSGFADSIAVSGSTALVGAPDYTGGGAAYIYTQSGVSWTNTATLTAPAGSTSFGTAVAISGSTAVVSANNGSEGVAYVYTLSGGAWVYTTELTGSDETSADQFGAALATSGGTIAVGAPAQQSSLAGATYIFTFSGGTWSQTGELEPADGATFDESGSSVAISETGTTVVAGAQDNANSLDTAYVFTLSGGAWTQAARLVEPTTPSYSLPAAVAISGTTIVLGGGSQAANGSIGQAYVYTPSGNGWGLAATLNPADSGGYFGRAVAISGNTIVVGAFGNNSHTGAAYVFTGSGANWVQQPTDLTAADGADDDYFGSEVAVSGSTILVSSESSYGTGIDEAYFFGSETNQTGPIFTVTNTSDTHNGGCYIGDCSLRDAITAADAYAGSNIQGSTIDFNLPAGVQTISPATQLPTITTGVTIDGTSEPGYSQATGVPLIDIDGANCATATCEGLNVNGGQTIIEGLAVEGFSGAGVLLGGGSHNFVTNDWIGENPATQAFDGNTADGVYIAGSPENTINDDTLAGNGHGASPYGANIEIDGSGSSGNVVSGDTLTGNPASTAGTVEQGVAIEDGRADNTIGGLGAGNDVISGYSHDGVVVVDAGTGNAIQGDTIGAATNGQIPSGGGQQTGIVVATTPGTIVGDDAAPGTQADIGYGNEVVGNTVAGVELINSTTNTTVAGNYIGNGSGGGPNDLGNAEGLVVSGGSTANVIGPGNTIEDNNLSSQEAGAGIGVEIDGPGNEVIANSIHDNGGPGIGGSFTSVAPPTLTGSTQAGTATAINGTVSGTAGSTVEVDLFDSSACGPGQGAAYFGQGATYLGSEDVTIGSGGSSPFSIASAKPSANDSITATDTTTGQPSPSTSVFSACSTVTATADNDAWTNAQLITTDGTGAGSATGSIDLSGQARWYKVPISPGGSVSVNLTNLPADYHLALFSDIGQAEASLTSKAADPEEPTTENLQALQAEMPGNAYSPSVFSPSVFSPSVFSPSVFSPSVFSPSVFSPSVFSPSVFSPSVFSPSVFSPSVFSPSVVSPSVFSPSVFSPSVFSPSVFSPSIPEVDSEDYAEAQIESLLGVSDTEGDADQTASADTWNNTGYFYIRVSGENGAYAPNQNFSLGVQVNSGTCGGVEPSTAALFNSNYTAPGSSYKTLILTDESRMTDDGDLPAMETDLQTFANESSVDGAIVDVGAISPRVQNLETQAGNNADCAYAQNLVADAIQQVVGAVRQANPGLKYIVIVGDDHVIPFFRYPDTAGLAAESGYVPPVLDTTPSYASLESNDFLSEDAYGSTTVLSAGGEDIPIPDLPVGRLVETPTEIDGMLNAYISLSGGVVATPTSSLVTGYDFMTSSANAVESNLSAGLGSGATNDTLITNDGVAPSDTGTPPSQSWTAAQLESALLSKRHDLIYLAGHFSANNTLAADDSTTMNATQLASSNVNLVNSIVFSPGCHSGYNIASEDAVPGVTQTTDWAGAFAQHEATLIAGTGYQYGDTDFLAYSDKLYADFSSQLLVGSGAVAVGTALTDAKSTYLDNTPHLQGIDIKAVLESTLYGLPMLSVDMPAGRTTAPTSTSIVSSTNAEGTDPGLTLGLSSADVTLTPSLATNTLQLQTSGGGAAPTATYLSGPNGVESSPAEPTLPLSVSDVSNSSGVLRGVGFMGGTYTDQSGITPLTGAPTSDLNSEHSTFSSSTFFPSQLFTVNYFGGLNGAAASTKLMLTPTQYESDAPGSLTDTQRSYSSVGMRLFYSNSTNAYGPNTPALAAPPTIGEISATVSGGTVTFQAHVVGDPSAGIQQVWVTYTGVDTPGAGVGEWESLNLTQDATDSTLWTGTLTGLSSAQIGALQFMVQAVNGVGLVGVDDNSGAYFEPGQIPPTIQTGAQALAPTTLKLDSPPVSASYGTTVGVSATLTSGSSPLTNAPITFTLDGVTVQAETNGSGLATAQIPINGAPGSSYQLSASYGGSSTLAGSASSPQSVAVTTLPTTLTLSGPASVAYDASVTGVSALLESGGTPVSSRSVTFQLTPTGSTSGLPVVMTAITDANGLAQLGSLGTLTPGTYAVTAFFGSGGPLSLPADPIFANSVTPAPPLALSVTGNASTFTSPSAATFTVGTAGTFPVTTTGIPTNTITVGTGNGCVKLPSGVTLTGNGNTATLSGTPASGTGGTYAICLTASNGVSAAVTQTFTLTVDQAPAITSAASATLTAGTSGSFPAGATGYPAPTFSLGTASSCVALPNGLSLTAGGVLSGTPAAGTGGTYAICMTASNGVGTAVTQLFTLTVDQAPAFTSVASATFTAGSAGSFPVTATGYPAATIAVATGSGCAALPSGLTLVGGVLSGTPATGGSYAICLTASNGIGTAATQAFKLTVNQASQGPAFTSAATATFTVGTASSFPVVTTGVPANTISLGTATGCAKLPSGVSLTGVGNTATLSGTPAAGTGGLYAICLTASNGVGAAVTQPFTLKINQAPAFTSPATVTFTPGTASSFSVTAAGYPAPTIALGSGSGCVALPKGLVLSSAGLLSGTPATGTGGTYAICLTASNGVGANATQGFTLKIATALSSGTTACNGTYLGTGANVTVSSGAACTLLPGTKLSGGVVVNPGGAINAQGVSIGGSVAATGAKSVQLGGGGTIGGALVVTATTASPTGSDNTLCNEAIGGSVSVLLNGPKARFDIGNLGSCSGGPGLTIGGSLLVGLNTAPVTIAGNTIKAALVVDVNAATLTITSNIVSGAIQVYSNVIGVGSTLIGNSGASCQLQYDKPTIAGSKNTVPAKAANTCNANA
jgi:hypothetical protein